MNDSVTCANLPNLPRVSSRTGGGIVNGTLVLCASWTPSSPGYPKECYKFDQETDQWVSFSFIGGHTGPGSRQVKRRSSLTIVMNSGMHMTDN